MEELHPKRKPEQIALPDGSLKLDPQAMVLPRIRSMGRSIFDPIWALKDHASRNTELLYILRGQVKVHTKDYVLPAREGQIIFTPNGLTHRDVFPLDSEFEVYLVHFEWEGEPSMLAQLTPAQLTEASRQDPATLASDMRQLYADFLQPGPLTAQLTSLRLLQVICRLWHHALAGKSPSGDAGYDLARARRVEIMTEAREVIHERYGQPLGLDDIAQAIDVSPYYLSRVFSQEAGFTLSSYLHDVRMEKAAGLLRQPRLPVSQVAGAVGFRDAHYFARVFKNHFGDAPSTYRSRIIARETKV
jgi:AraC-like DNA-binding protein